jgi:phosphatidylinositol alpha-mannosyltransferase
VKIGIITPYSWSYIGGVVEHAENQAAALRELGADTRVVMGYDPPGSILTRIQPRAPRPDMPPETLLPVGRSLIVKANGSDANIVLDPFVVLRLRRLLARERFDVIHVHEPMAPAISVAALALAQTPIVATWHATGELRLLRKAMPLWGFLAERIDYNIAVSELAAGSSARFVTSAFDVIPNGVAIPPEADPGGRENTIVFIGRLDPRKGLDVLLQAWPELRRRTGARLRLIGIDPAAARLALARANVSEEGVDLLGVVVGEPLTAELKTAKLLVAPSLGGESFGMVLTRAFASSTPAVASEIAGYRDVMTPEVGTLVPPGDPTALTHAVVELLEDEPRRRAAGEAARRLAVARYGWPDIARRLLSIYETLVAEAR